MTRWPAVDGMVFGADYNPEQWPRAVWREDMALMRQAGVNLVNLGVFSWAQVQPAEDVWDWSWMDEVLDLLHTNGIAVDLGTGTSSPPPWLTTKHPEILPVTVRRRDALAGRPSALAAVLAGVPPLCPGTSRTVAAVRRAPGAGDVARQQRAGLPQRRRLLRRRGGRVPRLAAGPVRRPRRPQQAWGTAFWSQRYSSWEQLLPPRAPPTSPIPRRAGLQALLLRVLQDYLAPRWPSSAG